MVSILVLTLNEENNLPGCLESVAWSDDVVVLDSLSTDGTVEVARRLGARVVQRPFDNWAAHQNWALEQISFKHPWVFYLDADERMTPALADEIKAIASDPTEPRVAFYCGRKNFFMGRWLRHAMPPDPVMRFFRPPYIRFKRLVNPVPVIQGQWGYLQNHLVHYNFSKGLSAWFEKHNRYSAWEAQESLKSLESGFIPWRGLLSSDRAVRRQALKELSFRLPCRPLLRFLYMYVFRRGFLDGRAGFAYCRLLAIYETMIVLKMWEMRRRQAGLPV